MNMTRKIVVFVVIGTLVAGVAAADAPTGISVSQSLDRAEMPYESTAVLEVSLRWQGSAGEYVFDRPPQLALDRLKVAKISSTVAAVGSPEAEVTTKTVTFILKPTSSGLGKIDPASFGYIHVADSVAGSVSTQALTISIAEPIRVAKRKAQLMATRTKLIVAAVSILLVVAAIFVVLRIRNRRPKPAVKTPAEVFLEDLGGLRTSSGGDLKRFQTGLYRQLTSFLASQYRLNLTGLSTQEILDLCEHTGMTDFQKHKIAGWLWRAEREKFSPLAVAPGETIRLEAELREFFEREMSSVR